MAGSQTQRPTFVEEQYLGADDLTAAVDYARLQQARHALGAHTWGIAAGLQLSETLLPGGGVSVHLQPGYAWDGYGRPIVVLSPFRIPEASFAAFTFDPAVDADGKGRLIPIWLRYEERSASDAHATLTCCDVNHHGSRIQETFAIQVGDVRGIGLTSGVNIAGRFVPDPRTSFRQFDPAAALLSDESVPHQNFPEASSRATWLIPVGFVRWLPARNQAGQFVARDDSGADPDSDKIRRARRYIGVVAEAIEAPDGVIRLRHRAADQANSSVKPAVKAQTDADQVWVEIEGNLRLSGLARKIDGGGWTVASDERLKRNVVPLTDALQLLLQMRGVRFEWKDANRTANVSDSQIGMVAQEVEKVFPDWVSTDPDGYRELTVRGFEALVIEALRELATDLKDLRSRLPAAKPSATKRKKTHQ